MSCGQPGTLSVGPGPTWPHAGNVRECNHTCPVKSSSYPKKVIHTSIWTQKHVFRRQNQPLYNCPVSCGQPEPFLDSSPKPPPHSYPHPIFTPPTLNPSTLPILHLTHTLLLCTTAEDIPPPPTLHNGYPPPETIAQYLTLLLKFILY